MATVHAVLLDMDGTLVDSDAAVERAWTIWSAEHGLDPAAVLSVAHGSPADRTVRRLLPALDDAAVAASAQRQLDLQYDDLSDVVAAPGAPELLAALDRTGLPWARVAQALSGLKAVRYRSEGRTIVQRTKVGPELAALLKRLGLSTPKRVMAITEAAAAPDAA